MASFEKDYTGMHGQQNILKYYQNAVTECRSLQFLREMKYSYTIRQRNCVAVRSAATQDGEDKYVPQKLPSLIEGNVQGRETLLQKNSVAGMRGDAVGVQISVEANIMLYICLVIMLHM